jgi:phage tail sheath protein FI
MAFQISPGVNVSEVDLTTVVPSVLTTAGAFAGQFAWGPARQVILVDNEITLKNTFGNPNSNSATSFFTAASFLAYGNNLSVVRAVNESNTNNAAANTAFLIPNPDEFEYLYLNKDNNDFFGPFMAKYPGVIGNSLKVEVCANTSLFDSWSYKSFFTSAPGTSDYAAAVGGSNDELHVVVVDAGGEFTGQQGTVLEVYPFLSKASDASVNGASNYYKQVIFNQSNYIYATDPVNYSTTNATWDKPAANNSFAVLTTNPSIQMTNGVEVVPTDGEIQTAFDLFANKEEIDISLVLTGDANTNIQQYVIDNIANARKDCVAFISPPITAVDDINTTPTAGITTWLSGLARSSSYVVADSGYKYMYDKYNNVYRYIPLNGDVAGLCVNTDTVRDPWYSPAGFNRGQIKNAIKLAFNPNKTQRDVLYAAGVNPVVSFPGQGIVLFGDKTLQNKPSAFDRINVRRLFIVLEKAISQAAQFSLFEFNDEFTRAQFVALVTPFLRDVQGRRGIYDFRVVCDTTNNTPQVIDSNQFVGDIYIKPARSINFIQLNFVAVGTGVDFTTIVGAA